MFKKKMEIELILDLSVTKDMAGIIIRDTKGVNISQRFRATPKTKCLNYKFISDNVLRKFPPNALIKVVQFVYDQEKDELSEFKITTGLRKDILGTMIA